jgi:hypothetical protein
MKKQLLKFIMISFLFAAPMMLSAQTIFLQENFSSGSLPAGWTNTSVVGFADSVWLFNNPYNRSVTGANFDASFAIFDSDDGSTNDNMNENAMLTTPAVNISGATTHLYLVLDEQYRSLGGPGSQGSTHWIEASTDGGSSWTNVLYDSVDVGYPNPANHSVYDLSSYVGNSTIMIRFHWTGSWDWWWAIDNVVLEDALPPPPANDECANAMSLTMGTTCNLTSFTLGNATSSGLPGCGGGVADDDVWFSFLATDVSCIVKLVSAGMPHTIEIFDGCGGTSITCINPGTASITSLFSGLTIGNTYYIAVYTSGTAISDVSTQQICLMSPPPPPANDDCGNAVSLTENATCQTTAGTLSGATNSNVSPCTGTADDDVWYSFIAADTVAKIEVMGHGQNDPVIEVFDGCGGTSLNCFNASGGNSESGLARQLTIGNTYYFRVYSYGTSLLDSSDFDVCVLDVQFPANDDCAGAIQITPANSEWECLPNTMVVTDLATASAEAISCSSSNYFDDVWYSFVANNTTMTVMAWGLSTDIVSTGIGYALYDGCGGTELFCQNPPFPNTRYTYTNFTIGNTYYLRTFTANTGITGSYYLCAFGGVWTGVPEAKSLADLQIYPNPSKGLLTIAGSIRDNKIAIKVYDMLGNMVSEKVLRFTDKADVDISALSNGIYYVKIENGKESAMQKIVLNK